jgi:hypothetical protein
MREFLEIVALCVAAAVGYGIAHDQITARVCVEYFTIGHPPVFATDSPTLLGFGWGVLATWWVGILLGTPLAVLARVGAMPRVSAREVLRPLLVLMAVSAICALVAGCIGFALAQAGVLGLREPLASQVPRAKHSAFLADLGAHDASYLGGLMGGVRLMAIVFGWRRQRLFIRKSGLDMVE